MKSKIVIMIFVILMSLIGCSSTNDSSEFVPLIGVKLVGESCSTVPQNFIKNISKSDIISYKIDALGVQQLDVVAYQYSPGFKDSTGLSNTCAPSVDWAYDVICKGTKRSRIVTADVAVDTSDFTDIEQSAFTSEFKECYTSFSMDFLVVNIMSPGIFANGIYYGTDTVSGFTYSKTYPQFEKVEKIYSAMETSTFPDLQADVIATVLARSDWFSTPVVVKFVATQDSVGNFTGYGVHSVVGDLSGIITLDDGATISQLDMIVSMVNKGTNHNINGVLFIVPYGKVLKVATSLDGPGIKNPIITIKFNFDWDSLVSPITKTYIKNGSFANHPTNMPDVWYASYHFILQDVNNVPLGMSCTVTDPSIVGITSN